ncbi:hypothetical protein Cantr_06915 [Candida viswanathii]|uniref:Uncharacterized protein n=1 Tax=Candida viswanathii TaxID=5486 RepID=A0A367XYX5_9ASCO|nr:hypothetical protein Cantr_06915 [Candida viswanathii]
MYSSEPSQATTMSSSIMINNGQPKVKTPLRKEELDQIARQLKKKLSKASITAKQSLSPTNVKATPTALPKSSPLKSYIMRKNASAHSLSNASPTNHMDNLNSSPINLYSPNGKSPTHIRTPAAAFLSSSPLKNIAHNDADDINTKNTLKPSLELESTPTKKPSRSPPKEEQVTPTWPKRELSSMSSSQQNSQNALLKTPKQSSTGNGFNDAEGADLLMFLATSPSPARPFYGNTPRSASKPLPSIQHQPPQSQHQQPQHMSQSSQPQQQQQQQPVPVPPPAFTPPPVTPKRVITSLNTRTPQNRLTPFFSSLNGGLPSQGLALTPTSFNMNDYVTFFTPSPGGAFNKNLLKTPDFHTSSQKK